jgi:carboxylesterase
VVVVHGFTGTPFEVRLLGEHLAAEGYAVEGPRLLGHGGSTADLAATRWPDWLASVESALARAEARAPVVGVVGLSLGALLTLETARRRIAEGKPLRAIAALAPALWLPKGGMRLASLLSKLPEGLLRGIAFPKIAGSDIADVELRRANKLAQGKAGMPFLQLLSLVEFGQRVVAELPDITTPTLVMHSRRDHTIPFACSQHLAAHLGGPAKLVALERSFHVITLDVERDLVFREVTAHLSRYLEA